MLLKDKNKVICLSCKFCLSCNEGIFKKYD